MYAIHSPHPAQLAVLWTDSGHVMTLLLQCGLAVQESCFTFQVTTKRRSMLPAYSSPFLIVILVDFFCCGHNSWCIANRAAVLSRRDKN